MPDEYLLDDGTPSTDPYRRSTDPFHRINQLKRVFDIYRPREARQFRDPAPLGATEMAAINAARAQAHQAALDSGIGTGPTGQMIQVPPKGMTGLPSGQVIPNSSAAPIIPNSSAAPSALQQALSSPGMVSGSPGGPTGGGPAADPTSVLGPNGPHTPSTNPIPQYAPGIQSRLQQAYNQAAIAAAAGGVGPGGVGVNNLLQQALTPQAPLTKQDQQSMTLRPPDRSIMTMRGVGQGSQRGMVNRWLIDPGQGQGMMQYRPGGPTPMRTDPDGTQRDVGAQALTPTGKLWSMRRGRDEVADVRRNIANFRQKRGERDDTLSMLKEALKAATPPVKEGSEGAYTPLKKDMNPIQQAIRKAENSRLPPRKFMRQASDVTGDDNATPAAKKQARLDLIAYSKAHPDNKVARQAAQAAINEQAAENMKAFSQGLIQAKARMRQGAFPVDYLGGYAPREPTKAEREQEAAMQRQWIAMFEEWRAKLDK